MKTASPVSAANQATITRYVQGYVSNLISQPAQADPRIQQKARTALADGAASPSSNTPASPAFLAAYAAALDAAVAPVGNDPDLQVRLNAAIAVQRAAERAGNYALMNSAAMFMKDPAEPVAMWGVKAADAIIPAMVRAGRALPPRSPNLQKLVIETAKRFPDSAPVIEDAYRALTLELPIRDMDPKLLPQLVAPLLDLFAHRLSLFQKGWPAEAVADTEATKFISNQTVWDQLNAQQQARAMQLLCDYINLVGQHAAGRGVASKDIAVFDLAGSALGVIGGRIKDQPIIAAAKAVRAIGVQTPGNAVMTAVNGACAAVGSSTKFPGHRPPPKLSAGASKEAAPEELEEAPEDEGGEIGTDGEMEPPDDGDAGEPDDAATGGDEG